MARLPIGDHTYLVEVEDGEVVLTNKLSLPSEVFSIPGRQSRYSNNPCIWFSDNPFFVSATHTLSFLATLPPLSWVTYRLIRTEDNNLEKEPENVVPITLDIDEEEVSSQGGRTLFYLPEVVVKFW